jgi:hypothetical protein
MLPPRQREVLDGPDVMAGPYCIVSSRRHAEIITVENLDDADTSRGLDLKINDQS